MTHEEKKQKVYLIAKKLLSKNGYIKGYGTRLDRLMDGDHNPIENISGDLTEILKDNNLVVQSGLVWVASKKNCELIKSHKEIKIETLQP